MRLAFYVSGHGFGHAARVATVINQLTDSRGDVAVLIRTSTPLWFLEHALTRPASIEYVDTDTGVAQITSLALDVAETARRAAAFYRTFHARVAVEATRLRDAGASVVVGDIPPLAFAAAAEAGVPSVALANFTWDWIYEGYPEFDRLAPETLQVVRRAYGKATLALRLPFHGGFETITHVRDVPLVARQSHIGRDEARRRLDVSTNARVVLASFGGHGVQIALDTVARQNDFILLATDYEGAADRSDAGGRLQSHTRGALAAKGLRYEDLVAAADVVVSKPGYGIVSECIANDTALLYTSRGSFAEQEVLVDGMQRVLRCRFIDQDELLAGRWQPSVDALLEEPPRREQMATHGADVVAGAIAEVADRSRSG